MSEISTIIVRYKDLPTKLINYACVISINVHDRKLVSILKVNPWFFVCVLFLDIMDPCWKCENVVFYFASCRS